MTKRAKQTTPAAAAREEVAAVYRELAQRPLERACIGRAECCQFKLTGKTPFLTRGEALLVAEALRSTGRTQLRAEDARDTCPLLDRTTLRCIVYHARPFGCRTHFCKAAGGPYARSEVQDLVYRLEKIDHGLGGTGAQHLRHAVSEMLKRWRKVISV